MRERPILFSGSMVRAILAGSKTQTRRVVKGTALDWLQPDAFTSEFVADPGNGLCPYGVRGDRLWVREAFCYADVDPGLHKDSEPAPWRPRNPNREDSTPWWCYYRATDTCIVNTSGCFCGPHPSPWRPSIHMPRWASRILLEVTSVRVERLQDITEEDAQAEGVSPMGFDGGPTDDCIFGCNYRNELHRCSFIELWESINGAGSWGLNPWVWVVGFKRVEVSP